MILAISVKFKHGLRADYERVLTAGQIDKDTLYFIEDTGEIFHGTRNLARGSYYEGTKREVDGVWESDNVVIARVIAEESLLIVKDDIFVIKTPITEDKTSYTSYVYDGSNWCAMDGNYNAENVYFDDNLTFTKEVGYATLENGSVTVESKGKNVKQLLEMLFAKETDPEVTNPTATLNVSAFTAYEVGTTVKAPAFTVDFDAGNYEFGPATGVTPVTYTVTFNGETINAASGNFADVQVTDGMSTTASVTVDYSAGVTPKTNLGNDVTTEGVAIAAGQTTDKSSTLSGYRKMFWGSMATDELTSDNIRALNSKKVGNGSLTRVTTAEGDVCVIVATPASAKKKIASAQMPLSMFYDAVNDFVSVTEEVTVEGAEGYDAVTYDIWMYKPASMTTGTQFDIVIANA